MTLLTVGEPTPGARTIVVTDGGTGQGRSALAAVRALALGGWRPVVTVSGRHSLAAASKWSAGQATCPRVDDDPAGYRRGVRRLASDDGVLGVMPASDGALVALEAPGRELIDKAVLAERAAAAGLDTVPDQRFADIDDLLAVAGDLSYPVVVKPTVSRVPAARCDDAHAVTARRELLIDAGPLVVQPFVTDPLRSVAGVAWNGEIIAAVHQRYLRTWPVDCGPSSAAITTAPDLALERGLGRLLHGYDGLFQAQFAGTHLLDLNLRVYGSLPLAVAAGANLPSLLCSLASGGSPTPPRLEVGVRYRWLEGDLRAIVAGLREGDLTPRAAAALARPRRGTVHSVASTTDPRPAVARAAHVLTSLRRG